MFLFIIFVLIYLQLIFHTIRIIIFYAMTRQLNWDFHSHYYNCLYGMLYLFMEPISIFLITRVIRNVHV